MERFPRYYEVLETEDEAEEVDNEAEEVDDEGIWRRSKP
jgi:hypothetical protein